MTEELPHDAPRRYLPAWLHGVLIAAWSVGLAWVYDALIVASADRIGPHAPTIGVSLWLEVLADGLGAPWLASFPRLFAVAIAAGAIVGAFFGWMGSDLDPERRSRDAFWWPFVRVRGFWLAVGVATIAQALALHAPTRWSGWGPIGFGAFALAWLLIPFGVLRRDVLTRRDGAGWWRPRWPGFATTATFLALAGAAFALGWLELPSWVGLPFHVVTHSLLMFAAAIALIDRVAFDRLGRIVQLVLNRPSAGSLLALWSRGASLGLWFAAPMLLLSWFATGDGPHLQILLQRQGSEIGALHRIAATVANELLSWWWLYAILPGTLLTWLSLGRLHARSVDG